MKLKDINEIKEDGLVVFMPSGIQATLFNEGKKILVKYYNLKEDRYTIKDFKKVIAEGIEVFSDQPTIPQQSVLMESYGWSIPELELGDSGFDSPEEAYQNAKMCLEDNNYEVGDFDGEGCSVYDPGDEEMGFLPFDGYCVIESDEEDDIDWEDEDEDDMDESVLDMLHKKGYIRDSLMEAYEKVKNPEGQVFKALKDKKKEYITPEFKLEMLNCLDRIAREYPDVKIRQQALTFMDEINMQEYWDTKAVQDFIKKPLEMLNAHVNESMEDVVTVVDIPLVTEKLYNKLVNLLYGNKQGKNRDYEQQQNVLNFLQEIEDKIAIGAGVSIDLEDYGFTTDEINTIKKIVRDERVDESLNEELQYGVEYRNMHDGIHRLLVTDTKEKAEQILAYLKELENPDTTVYDDNEIMDNSYFTWDEINKLADDCFEVDYREIEEGDGNYNGIYVINYNDIKPDIYESLNEYYYTNQDYEMDLKDNSKKLTKEADKLPYTDEKDELDAIAHNVKKIAKQIDKDSDKFLDAAFEESLNEDENSMAEEIRRGNKSGQDPKFGNWLLETSLDEKWEQLTNDMKLYLMDGIADFVQQGSLKEQDLLLEIDPMTGLTKEDVQSLEMFDQEEIDYTFSSEDLQLNAYISYEIKTDLDTPKDMEESVNEDIKIGDICKCSNIFVKVDQIKGNTALVKPIHQEDIDAGKFEKREIVLLSELQKEDFYNESVNEDIYLKKENGEEVGPFENQEAEEQYIKDQKDNGNEEEYEEIIKEENMSKKNEDCYKVYNTIDPDSQPLSFNSWNEVEDHLNKEWGDYKVSMAKENAEFGTDEDRDNFMGNFEIAIEPIEIPAEEIPAEGIELEAEPVIEPEEEVCPDCEETEVCPECGKEPCECETEEPIDDLEEDFEDEHIGKSEEEPIEEPEQEESEEETEEEINTPEEAADKVDEIDDALDSLEDFLNTLIGDEELTDEEKAEIDALETKEPAKEVEEKNEEFSDNMGMLTDINDLDFPDALANTVETKEDGSLYRLGDLAKEIEEVKSSMEEFKNSFKSELATMLQDLKNDLKLSVNNVETKVQDTKSAVDNLTSEEEDLADIEFDQEEAPVEEQGEEAPEEGQEEPSQEESEEEFEESLKGNRVYECIKAVIKNNKHPKGMISIPTIAEKLREDYGIDTNTRTKFGQQTYNQVANIISHTSLKENVVDVVTEERERKRAMLGEAANWLGGGLMSKLEQQSEQAKWENLEKVKQEIDQAVQKGADAEQLKDQITLSSEDENEEKQAKDYAVQKLQQKNMTTESLLATLKNTVNTSTLRNIRFQ